MKIYRVEKEGLGPYHYENISPALDALLADHCDPSRLGKEHPAWEEDLNPYHLFEISITSPDLLSGFDTEAKLYKWFSNCIQELIDNGFSISVYEFEDYDIVKCNSHKQVIVIRHTVDKPSPIEVKPLKLKTHVYRSKRCSNEHQGCSKLR